MTTSAMRVGIVGAGNWAQLAHVPAFQQCPGTHVLAICDIDLGRAELVAAEAGIPYVYRTTAEMLAAHNLDLVSIVTPDDCHRADAEAAIAAGAHVLCEKPLATTVTDARALTDLAAAAGVFTRIGFAMRFAPAMARLRELVTSGDIGEPHLLQAFQQNGQFLDAATPFHWKMDGARTGGGAIVEYGIHTIDLASWIMGDVVGVCATSRTWTPLRPTPDGSATVAVDVDDSTAWLMEFHGGAIGVCHASWATVGRPPGLEVRVFGSEGAVRCRLSDELPNAESLEISESDGLFQSAEISAGDSSLTPDDGPWWFRFPARLIGSFVSEIAVNQVAGPTFADGLRAQEILEAILVSSRERRWVNVEYAAR